MVGWLLVDVAFNSILLPKRETSRHLKGQMSSCATYTSLGRETPSLTSIMSVIMKKCPRTHTHLGVEPLAREQSSETMVVAPLEIWH